MGAPRTLDARKLKHWMTKRTRCKSERCWVEKAPLEGGRKREIIKDAFRPDAPASWKNDPDEWLDSDNIKNVMKQYEESNPEFKFYGANPIDFSAPDPYNKTGEKHCLEDSICKIDLKALEAAGKTKLGFVYNLDPHFKGGSHWIASFTDIPAHRSYYFDSYGMKTPPQVARFMRSLTLQDPKMKLEYCSRRLQYGDSECGMYCLYFLIRMIEGDSFKQFIRRAPRDPGMLELRRKIFARKDE